MAGCSPGSTGGDRYATLAGLNGTGGLVSSCTCPYGLACRHAVAVVLAYLRAVEKGTPVSSAAADDERLTRVVEGEADGPEACEEWVADRPASAGDDSVQRYIESLSPQALAGLAQELAADLPDVRRRIADRAELRSGDTDRLIARTRREIARVTERDDGSHHWSGGPSTPDWSSVRERLEALLAAGRDDDVLDLGRDLLERGIRQVEASNDEGETARELADCMTVVVDALVSSSLTIVQRLLWEIDSRLKDDYGIFGRFEVSIGGRPGASQADWSVVADELARRLKAPHAAGPDDDSFSRNYRRNGLMEWVILALTEAGREKEIRKVLEREAEITFCYVELVDHLVKIKDEEAAERWARRGFACTVNRWPGIAWGLEERLRKLAQRRRDAPLAAAFRALEFVDRPDVERYVEVRNAAEPLGLWESVRRLLLQWLETGEKPEACGSKRVSPAAPVVMSRGPTSGRCGPCRPRA